MRILLIDDDESRRETIAAHTGAEVVRVVPRTIEEMRAATDGCDALAFGGIGCEAGWEYDAIVGRRGYGRRRGRCHKRFEHDLWSCGCAAYRDAILSLRELIQDVPDGFRVVFVGEADDDDGFSRSQYGLARELSECFRVCDGEVFVSAVSPMWREPYRHADAIAALRTAFGLPLDSEETI